MRVHVCIGMDRDEGSVKVDMGIDEKKKGTGRYLSIDEVAVEKKEKKAMSQHSLSHSHSHTAYNIVHDSASCFCLFTSKILLATPDPTTTTNKQQHQRKRTRIAKEIR